jgi:two-component system osmolarity sensor histidine kinase EnvZ
MVLSAQTWVELPPTRAPPLKPNCCASTASAARRPALPAEGQPLPCTASTSALWNRRCSGARAQPCAADAAARACQGEPWLWTPVSTRRPDPWRGLCRETPEHAATVGPGPGGAAGRHGPGLGRRSGGWRGASHNPWPAGASRRAAGRRANPDLLPQTGPRELARLAGHFNQMALQVRELLAARTTCWPASRTICAHRWRACAWPGAAAAEAQPLPASRGWIRTPKR